MNTSVPLCKFCFCLLSGCGKQMSKRFVSDFGVGWGGGCDGGATDA